MHTQAAAAVNAAAGWAGKYTGKADIVALVGRILATLLQVGHEGGCVPVHPVNAASQQYEARWRSTDLADALFLTPTGYFSANVRHRRQHICLRAGTASDARMARFVTGSRVSRLVVRTESSQSGVGGGG